MNSVMVSTKPIAVFRSGTTVMVFLDSTRGWNFLTAVGDLPRSFLVDYVASVEQMIEAGSNWAEVNGDPQDAERAILVVPLASTTLPPGLPDGALVGMHPSLDTGLVPVWGRGAGTEET